MVVEEAAAPGEPMDINAAVKMVLKKALAHDGLCRGLHEACRCGLAGGVRSSSSHPVCRSWVTAGQRLPRGQCLTHTHVTRPA